MSPVRDPVKSVRLWQKQQLLSAYERARETEKVWESLQNPKPLAASVTEPNTDPREKRQTPTQRWSERLSRHRKEESERLRSAARRGDQSMQELERRICKLKKQKQEEVRLREAANRSKMQIVKAHLQRRDRNEVKEMEDRLQRYQTRMDKSERCHSQILKSRSLTVASRRQHGGDTPQENDSLDRLMDYLQKHQEREQKLEQHRESLTKTAEKQRKSREDRWTRVAKNKKVTQQKSETRTRELERRNAESVSAVTTRHQSVMKETFYRGEQQREREDQIEHNRRKLKRIQSARQAQILHRSVEEARRVESLKQSRRYHVEKYEEALHSSLIERDRTYELVEVISKSPHSKRAQQVMKELSDSSL